LILDLEQEYSLGLLYTFKKVGKITKKIFFQVTTSALVQVILYGALYKAGNFVVNI
jgi:hypothetical protein